MDNTVAKIQVQTERTQFFEVKRCSETGR